MIDADISQSRAAPIPVDALVQRITEEYADLSRQLKQIALYVERHRDLIGLEKIEEVAAGCEVHPSAVVRFAKHFGYSGYREFQKVFRDGLALQIEPNRNYRSRIRKVIDQRSGRLSSADIAYEFIGGAIDSMVELQRDLPGLALNDAVESLAQAPALWVVGSRRSFPVAAYLAYALHHTDKPVHLITGVGAMTEGQMRGIRPADVMIAISFPPYAKETLFAIEAAASRGAKLIAITDSRMSPLWSRAQTTFLVQDGSSFGFRALSNVMALAQSLFIALAYRLELDERSIASATSEFSG